MLPPLQLAVEELAWIIEAAKIWHAKQPQTFGPAQLLARLTGYTRINSPPANHNSRAACATECNFFTFRCGCELRRRSGIHQHYQRHNSVAFLPRWRLSCKPQTLIAFVANNNKKSWAMWNWMRLAQTAWTGRLPATGCGPSATFHALLSPRQIAAGEKLARENSILQLQLALFLSCGVITVSAGQIYFLPPL